MLLSYGVFLFLPLIIPPPGGGGVNKDRFPTGPFFFALNYSSRCRGRNSKCCVPTGAFFFTLNYPWPVGADEINIPPAAAGDKYIYLPLPREGYKSFFLPLIRQLR